MGMNIGGYMNVLDAIYTRQSVGKMKPDPVPKADIEKLLSAAVQAPNHYKVRPWRFVVLTGEGRSKLGDVMAQVLKRRFPDVEQAALDKERGKPLRSPVVIAVGVDKPDDPRVLEIENVCAAAAACENILLAAGELGLAGHWRTGDAAREPEIKKFLALQEDQELIAFLYIGYPEVWPPARERPGYEERTSWIE
jgi:nitroreductase